MLSKILILTILSMISTDLTLRNSEETETTVKIEKCVEVSAIINTVILVILNVKKVNEYPIPHVLGVTINILIIISAIFIVIQTIQLVRKERSK